MKTPELVRDLQHRLSALLEDPAFAKARQDRATQRVGSLNDATIAHNLAISEEILHLENDPPEDIDRGKYCSWKARYIDDDQSLCRYCNCLPWPQ